MGFLRYRKNVIVACSLLLQLGVCKLLVSAEQELRLSVTTARKLKIISASTRGINNRDQTSPLRGARMQLKPFLLDAWLDQYEHSIEFNLAASTGPTWTVNDILGLADEETRHRFLNHKLVYSRPAGADSLREAIAEMHDVPGEAVQIVTGASEALVALMWLAAEPAANVHIPLPGLTP